MAKRRSESAKVNNDNSKKASSAFSSVSRKSNAISAKNGSTTLAQLRKREFKSTDGCSKRASVKQGDCKDLGNEKVGPSKRGKKRNASLQESDEYPVKKLKVELAKLQTQKDVQIVDDDKRCSLQEQRKSAKLLNKASKRGKVRNQIKSQVDSSVIEDLQSMTTGEGKGKKKMASPSKLKHMATPEDIQKSPRKDKVVGKKLKLDLIGSEGEKHTRDNVIVGDRSSSDESSDDEGVAWEDVDEANVVDHVLEGQSASTSHHHQSPRKNNVEISITVPGAKKKKKGWSQEDVMKYIKRAVNRFRKDVFIKLHKVHVLTLVAHGFFRNGICNEPLLQAVLLSHVPVDFLSGNKRKWDVARLTDFLKWFQGEFSSTDDAKTGDKEIDKQVAKLLNLSEVFVTILRALGFLTRLVYSLQPMSAKGDIDKKTSPKTTKKKITNESKTAAVKNTPKGSAKKSEKPNMKKDAVRQKITKTKSECNTPTSNSMASSPESKSAGCLSEELNIKKRTKENVKKECGELLSSSKNAGKPCSKNGKGSTAEDKGKAVDKPMKQNARKRPLRRKKRVDYSLCDNENGSDAEEEWNGQSSDSEDEEDLDNSKKKNKTPLVRKRVSSADSDSGTANGGSGISFVDLVDDDSDFEVTSKPLVKRRLSSGSSGSKKKSIKILSSDESDESVKCLGSTYNEQDINWWTEVYLPVDKKWICVHLESSSINHPELCEKQATQPLVYVLSFDNKNAVKDVTNRYASSWMSKTRKLRTDSDWWEDTLEPYKSRNKKMSQMEDSHLEDQLLDKPLPTSITEYKNHPLYVLKRHLLKFEGIYPETAAILGYCRGEAVYSRDCVHLLHTREKWLNEALVVKQGEKAYKIVKGRPKRNQPIHERDSVTIDLFGRWQTEKYKPPPAKDGKVPRNEYGNVELFLPCMLPPGTKHIQINGIQRVAKKLGIDCAQAVVGFDFHCGFSHPVIDGVVVCEEFEQTLLEAWQEEEEQAEKRKAEKREKRMLANWRLLTRSLLIRERLKKRYDTEKPETSMAETSTSANENNDVVTDTAISWPLNRQEGKTSVANEGHCHVFRKSGHRQDPVTGEWTKSCSCGLTLPFEKM